MIGLRRFGLLFWVLALMVVPNPSSAMATGGNSITSPDSSGNVGPRTSIALDASGQPVVSYFGTGNKLHILHCDDPNCESDESANIEVIPVTGGESSLVLDDEGHPVVSYFGSGLTDLKLLHCGDPSCTSGNSEENPDVAGLVGGSSSLQLDASGNPVIVYDEGWPNFAMRVLSCDDPNCAGDESGNVTIFPGGFGSYSLALDASEFPVISYHVGPAKDLRILHCGNAYCTANNVMSVPDFANVVGSDSSMVLDASGHPVVSYYDGTLHDLKILHCDNPDCAGDQSANISTPDPDGDLWQLGWDTSLELDSAGNPVVSYYDVAQKDLRILHCNDPLCTGDDESISIADSQGFVGRFSSLALDSAGNPVVSYLDETNNNLKVLHCWNPDCSDQAPTSVAPSPIVSPVFGPLEFLQETGCPAPPVQNPPEDPLLPRKWCFNQHMLSTDGNYHGPGLGPGGADDTNAWDLNNNGPDEDRNFDANTPVYAVGEGVVAKTFGGQTNLDFVPNTNGLPNGHSWVLIRHVTDGNVWWSGYQHMKEINPALAPGVAVDANTLLGKIGDVGATNFHLHFVVYEGSNTNGGLVSKDVEIFQRLKWFPLENATTAGSSSIDVVDQFIYSIGDLLTFNPGGANEEQAEVTGFSSLILASPLENDHAAGEPIIVTTSGDPDTDDDGCDDDLEFGLDETLGGLRDYENPWDFYDVAGSPLVNGGAPDGVIDLPNDILGVIQRFAPLGTEPKYDVQFDRGPSAGPNPWNMTAPDGVIDLPNDILGVILQFNHSCQ